MQVSATTLGQAYSLTGEEMNRVLEKNGFLQGRPGDYSVTEKALPYVVEKEFHRGTGGYSSYNRYWTTRTYDDSIKEALDVPDDLIDEVRNEITSDRAARFAAQKAAREKANSDFLAKQASELSTQEEITAQETEVLSANWKMVGKTGLVVGGFIIMFFCIYKAAPKVKAWWASHKQRQNEETNQYKSMDDNQEEIKATNMIEENELSKHFEV